MDLGVAFGISAIGDFWGVCFGAVGSELWDERYSSLTLYYCT